MHRASIGDLEQARTLLGSKIADQLQFGLEAIDFFASLLTVRAILGVNAVMIYAYRNSI